MPGWLGSRQNQSRSLTMDFTLEPGRNRRNRGAEHFEAGYRDITSSFFQSCGQYSDDATLHGLFVPSSLNTMDLAAQSKPESGEGSFATIGLDEDSIFGEARGLRDAFLNGLRGPNLDGGNPVAAPSQANGQNEDLEPVLNTTVYPYFEIGFDIYSQVENGPLHITAQEQDTEDRHYETPTNDSFRPFQNDFYFPPQAVPSPFHMFPEQQNGNYRTAINRPFLSDFAQESPAEQPNGNYQSDVNGFFLSDLDLETPNDNFSDSEPGQGRNFLQADFPTSSQETALSFTSFRSFHNAETNPTVRSMNPELSFSSNEFDFLDGVEETSPSAPPADPEMGLSSSEFDFLDSFLPSSQESSLSNLMTATSPSTPATTLSSSTNSPDRYSCHKCPSVFKRAGDLKRHQGVHLPRNFHCRQSGCRRKGRNGFYRRDKLRAHMRQAHGMDL
jgi:hypothetical protein